MDLFEAIGALEGDDDLHESRLLLLLDAFTGDTNDIGIAGLTKLAKLDFLLRYPALLERALVAKGRSVAGVHLQEHEKNSVESRMVRYRFGPWDHRYRRFLNLLVAKDLIKVQPDGRTINLTLTDKGKSVAHELKETAAFADLCRRAKTLKTHFDVQGTTLMRFIYETFPEMVSLKMNEPIDL